MAAELAAEVAALRSLDDLARAYVQLVLALGEHDPDTVDAYYGPSEWRAAARAAALPLDRIEQHAQALRAHVADLPDGDTAAPAALIPLRRRYLEAQLRALATRAQICQGRSFGFDQEVRRLYDTEAPRCPDDAFEPLLARIAALLPQDAGTGTGTGTLAERYNRYLGHQAIPPARIEAVMQAAIAAARARTATRLPLPPGERFELALVGGRPWSAYNWYQGGYASRIELNTALPLTVGRVIELAAHEGYPGHHVYNALLEQRLVRGLGWPEFQVYALFSPQSLIAEGTADYGIGLAFPGADRQAFAEALFRLAGLDAGEAGRYLEITALARELAPAGIEAARRYLDGAANAEQTQAWLQRTTLASPERARQRLAFFERYRAYIVNYSWGETLVRRHVEASRGGAAGSPAAWQAYLELLTAPCTPSLLSSPPP